MSRAMTRRLVRLTPSAAADGAGGVVRGWSEGAALWGEVRLRSGGARTGEWGPRERVRARIAVHALPPGHPARPVPGDRLRDGVRLWSVEAVQPEDLTGRYLVLFVTSVREAAA